MASFACSCRYLFIADIRESLNLRGHRSSETVHLSVCPQSQSDWRVSSSIETIVVRRTRQGNAGCQCELRMVVSQLSGQTFDDSDQILQVCRDPMKFTRCRQETNTSNTCQSEERTAKRSWPFPSHLQFVASKLCVESDWPSSQTFHSSEQRGRGFIWSFPTRSMTLKVATDNK